MDRDWPAVVERLCEGDRLAFLELNRLVTGFLAQLRAYDFREEWDDLRQEVVASVVANAQAGRLRDPQAFVGYVKVITRNKFVDRLKRQLRHREKETLPWDEETARAVTDDPDAPERRALWQAVSGLPEEQRQIVEGVYREGRTYEEVSAATGVPLGTLKRRLRESVALLRERLRDE
ncbi:MAG: RNA polymerase sigma factor, partial [Deltaproteobacteria bacterium]|nr:RNA polymerase sigma factor [Deltaproteobacteria bacterium]